MSLVSTKSRNSGPCTEICGLITGLGLLETGQLLRQVWMSDSHDLAWWFNKCKNSILFYSILGCVVPLQEVACHQSPPTFSVLCCPCPYRSLVPHNVISPTMFQSSNWSYTLCLPLCASNSSSIIFHSGNVSSPFPFRICYILYYVCHSGSLPNDGVSDSDRIHAKITMEIFKTYSSTVMRSEITISCMMCQLMLTHEK